MQSTYFELVRGGQLRVEEGEGACKQRGEEGWKGLGVLRVVTGEEGLGVGGREGQWQEGGAVGATGKCGRRVVCEEAR
jgi:hypothetical protein